MPKAHSRRSHRSVYHGRRSGLRFTFTHLAVMIIVVGLLIAWWLTATTNAAFPFSQTYKVSGHPTISADFINHVLEHYHSPAAGKGQALYNDGVKYDIDPVYALAFFMHESSFGTTGIATVTHSLGNIRYSEGYQDYEGYRKYDTWEEGFEDWYRLIADQYVKQWGLTTVDQIIPVYAPSSDNNDVAAYIQAVKNAVDTWRSGNVEISGGSANVSGSAWPGVELYDGRLKDCHLTGADYTHFGAEVSGRRYQPDWFRRPVVFQCCVVC